MRFKDLANFLGFSSQEAAAKHFGKSQNNWQKYLSGERSPGKKLVSQLTAGTNLMHEKIFFSDVFDHPFAEDEDNPFYWLNLANEALNHARQTGELTAELRELQTKILEMGKHLPDLGEKL